MPLIVRLPPKPSTWVGMAGTGANFGSGPPGNDMKGQVFLTRLVSDSCQPNQGMPIARRARAA